MANNNDNDDIEREIMLEMEKEIQRSQLARGGGTSTSVPPPFELTPMPQDDEADKAMMTEEQQIQAEIEARLQRKKKQREADELKRREAEEQARREAEELKRREAEELKRREAEEQARRQAEELKRREAEELKRREAEELKRREAEEQARREAEELKRREAEELKRREAEEQARRQAEELKRREAEEQARRQAEEQARRQAEEQARRQAEELKRREAEEQARRQAEELKRREAEEQARREAEEKARADAYEAALEEIRKKAREQVFREYAEKARLAAESGKPVHFNPNILSELAAGDTSSEGASPNGNTDLTSTRSLGAEGRQASQSRDRASESTATRGNAVERQSSLAVDAPPSSSFTRTEERHKASRASPLSRHTKAGEDKSSAALGSSSSSNRSSSSGSSSHASSTPGQEEGGSSRTTSQAADRAHETLRNDNGILARHDGAKSSEGSVASALSAAASRDDDAAAGTAGGEPLIAFEHMLQEQRPYAASQREARGEVEVHRYGTIREPGRCLFPPTEMDQPVPAHAALQLGFFSAKQTILALQPAPHRPIAQRERRPEGKERPLHSLTCYFEHKILEDPTLTVDDEDEPYNAPSEQLLSRDDLQRGGEAIVRKALSAVSYGDPIQVWEQVRAQADESHLVPTPGTQPGITNASSPLVMPPAGGTASAAPSPERTANASIAAGPPSPRQASAVAGPNNSNNNSNNNNTSTPGTAATTAASTPAPAPPPAAAPPQAAVTGVVTNASMAAAVPAAPTGAPGEESTANFLWVSGVETRKPIPAMRTFTGGHVLRVEARKLSSQVAREHGEGTDPFVVAAGLYAINENVRSKVSETFYFDAGLDIFFPHKERSERARDNKVVVFIPNEFISSLHLVVRVYRPCAEDFDTYVDLYARAERYKPVHVAPMKQEALLLARESDVFEELGWYIVPLTLGGKEATRQVTVEQLYRKTMSDAELLKIVGDKRFRAAMKTLPMDLQFAIDDVSKFEVAFPTTHAEPTPEENETLVSLLDPDVPGARSAIYRYTPCCIPILNSGYFTTYVNVYYLRLSYMRVLNTGALRNLPATHHSYALQICVKDRDDSLSEENALRCIYGRSLTGLSMDTHTWSSSTHGSFEFAMSDEVKIQMPLNLTDQHHIFFILYGIHQKRASPNAGQPRMIKIGYAALPLLVNGVVNVSDHIELKFVAQEQAAVTAAGGYLANFPKAPKSALLNGGEIVLSAGSQARTSVYASNRIIASVFRLCPPSIAELRRDDGALEHSGELASLPAPVQDPHREVITQISQLPLAEILAFYPFLSSYAFSLIASPSRTVSLGSRMHMLDVLLLITNQAQQYDTNTHTIRRRHGTRRLSEVFARTTVASIVYHFLTNNTLYAHETEEQGAKTTPSSTHFRLYAGLAETWLHLLSTVAGGAKGKADEAARGDGAARQPSSPRAPAAHAPAAAANARNMEREMSDLSWFLFDAILRSIYLWADEHPGERTAIFDPSFYTVIGELCVQVLRKLSVYDESTLVRRVALFTRGLMHYCDRGQVLRVYERIVQYFGEQSNYESMTNYLRYILQDQNVVHLLLPTVHTHEPVYLTHILVDALSVLLVQHSRDIRSIATEVLYSFLRRLANDATVPGAALTGIAAQLFELVRRVAPHWRSITQSQDKANGPATMHDKRQLAMVLLWILYYTPQGQLRRWLRDESDVRVLAAVMRVVGDAQSLFRYSGGVNKGYRVPLGERAAAASSSNNNNNASAEAESQLRSALDQWDARNATFVNAIGTQLCSLMLHSLKATLRTVKQDSPSVCALPFFILLESVLHLGNSTIALQSSSALLYETVRQLFPEVISRKAKMSSGLVLLTFRLMSSCCQYVRSNASWAFLLMSQAYFSWKRSLAKIKSLTANALVSVAESKSRDLRLAGRFIEFQFDELIDTAKVEEANFLRPSADFDARFEEGTSGLGGDAQMRYRWPVSEEFLSVQRILPISPYLLEEGGKARSGVNKSADEASEDGGRNGAVTVRRASDAVPVFSAEFAAMTSTVLSLFDDVLRLQVDDSMKFKEAKVFAYFEVFRNFLQQNALSEALKWLYRLHEAHKANNDLPEAGMVLVFIAALCFRVTEVYYFVKGKASKGARMPYGIFSRVFWHDYVRVLPEVEQLLSADTVYAIVSELYVCPDEACFTVEGQVKTLKEAAELLDKGQYYEFSLDIIHLVDRYVVAISDHHAAAVVHTAMSTWHTAIAEHAPRRNHRYYLLWARMERAEPAKTRKQQMLDAEDSMVGEKPCGLERGRPIRRIYKMPPNTTIDEFKSYAKAYLDSLFPDSALVVLTDELTETLPALPAPDSKRKRIAASHRAPNHCLLTVSEVQAYFPKGIAIPPDGYDKTRHIHHFENVRHEDGSGSALARIGAPAASNLSVKASAAAATTTTGAQAVAGATSPLTAAAAGNAGGSSLGLAINGRGFDVMSYCITISTYELDRAFPSTTSAIDIATTHKLPLNAYETAEEIFSARAVTVQLASESDPGLIALLKEALMVRGLGPGVYMREVIARMADHGEVIDALRSLSQAIRKKLEACDTMGAMMKAPEDYAMVLKGITDVECCLVAMESTDERSSS